MDQITTAVATDCATKTCASLGGWIANAATKWSKEKRLSIPSTYKEYILKLAARHSHTRTFFDRTEGRYIYEFYVPSSLQYANTSIKTPTALSISQRGRLFVVSGQGGSGKSMLMRHLLVDSLLNYIKVPVFIELRNVTSESINLVQIIADSLAENGLEIDQQDVIIGLKTGVFFVLLDGFDEVDPAKKPTFEKEIQRTASRSNCEFILSSRPDSKFHSWNGWQITNIAPLTVDQACELVEKASFNKQSKIAFSKKLRGGLYKSHRSFLSNPLLLSIMLLTHEHDADIPTKLSVFYSRAYDALFTQHDALKGEYNRPRKTNLDITDFARIFSSFCFLTYLDRKFIFGLSYATDKITAACSLSSISVDATKYLQDAKQAVCLLVEEGLDISFTHRSFQEYFCARYISSLPEELKKQFIVRLAEMPPQDSVMDLLYEMDSDSVNNLYLIPAVEKQLDDLKISDKINVTSYNKFMKQSFDGIILLHEEKSWALFGRGVVPIKKRPIIYAMMKWIGKVESDKNFKDSVWLWLNENVPKEKRNFYKFSDAKYGDKLLRLIRDGDWPYSRERLRLVKSMSAETKAAISSKDDLLKRILSHPSKNISFKGF